MNVYICKPDDYSAMRGPCASGFHVPDGNDYAGLSSIMTALGLSTDWSDKLHLPLAGWRGGSTGNVGIQGKQGRYWLNELNSSGDFRAYHFNLPGTVGHGYFNKAYGMSIRPFKDNFVKPASTWTVIAGTLGSAGIFRDTVNGLISITGDGVTGYTIADKNLGATTVWSNGDALLEANCGKYYQWGNNYGFPRTGAITTSSAQVNASSYGPGNYYSSSTFITASGGSTWDSSNNDNLRGLVTGIGGQSELKNAYIGEYKGFEYSYDFRNKTTSQVTADGWVIRKGGCSFNSYGVRNDSSDYMLKMTNKVVGLQQKMISCKKLIIEFTRYTTGEAAFAGGMVTESKMDNLTGVYQDNRLGEISIFVDSSNIIRLSGTISGTVKFRGEFDLINKTAALSWNGNSPTTATLTDEMITKIRNEFNAAYIYFRGNPSTSNLGGLSDLSIKVE